MFLFFTLFFCFYFSVPVLAWDTNIAHPEITLLAVDLYNQNSSQKITDEQKKWIMEGAIEEDMPLRWFNHFYDPIYNKGFKNLWSTSPVWANDSYSQADYALGDNSWGRALVDYHKNNQKAAFMELGHTLHLVEDMLVPAHTRNDSHPSGDSLEQFVKFNWEKIKPLLPAAKINDFSNLNSAFVSGASYSNNNFYSDDTIESGDYKKIKVVDYKKIKIDNRPYIISEAKKDKDYFLYISDGGSDWNNKSKKAYSVDNGYILLDYSQHLLPQAIGNAAGVINLFFEETKKDPPKVSWLKTSPLGVLNKLAGDLVVGVENLMGDSIYSPVPMPSMASEQTFLDTNTSSENNISETVLPVKNNNQTSPAKINPKILTTTTPITPLPVVKPNPNPEIISPTISTTNTTTPSTTEYYNPYLNPYHENYYFDSNEPATSTPIVIPTSTPTTTPENPTSTPPAADTTPPTVPIISINNLSGFNSVELKISLSASDNSNGEIYFDLDYALEPVTTSVGFAWQNFISNTTSTELSFFGERGKTYYFRARAHDTTGNYSDWSPEDAANIVSERINYSYTVVFNEIDWAGWGASGDNNDGQWLELRNNTSQEIDLTNWQIKKDNIPLAGTVVNSKIAPGGYYLIEASQNAVGKTPADRFLSSGFLMKGNNLSLINPSGEITDEVSCSSTGWFAGSKEKLASMERLNSRISGNDKNNWRTAPGIRITQVYSGSLFGLPSSPRITNFAPIILEGNQAGNEVVLTAAGGPYILGDYTVPAGKSLKIEAGVVLKSVATNSALRVSGSLTISGTSTNRVLITSGRDTSDGSPLFGSYAAAASTLHNDWYGIVLYGGARADITGLDLRGAGASRYLGDGAGGFVSNGITANGAIINISDSVFKNNGSSTLNFDSSSSTIYNCIFDGGEMAIRTNNTNIDFNNLTLRNYTSGRGPFELRNGINNKITWGSDITFENNANNRLFFSGFNFKSNFTLPALKYVVGSFMVSSSVLTLLAGTDLAFLSGNAFDIKDGGIEAQGTADNPVNIGPIAGARAGFFYFRNSVSNFNYTNFGAASFTAGPWYGDRASLIIGSSTINFNNTLFSNPNGANPLVLAYSSRLSFVDSGFYSPTKYHDAWSSSVAINAIGGGGLVLKNCSFENFNYGFLLNPMYTSFNPFVLSNLTFTNVDVKFYSGIPYPISIGEPLAAISDQTLTASGDGLEAPAQTVSSTESNLDLTTSTNEVEEANGDSSVVLLPPIIDGQAE